MQLVGVRGLSITNTQSFAAPWVIYDPLRRSKSRISTCLPHNLAKSFLISRYETTIVVHVVSSSRTE